MVVVDDKKMAELKEFIASCSGKEHPDSFLVAVLHRAQSIYGFLPENVMDEVAHEMQIPTAHIWGVATFYHYFKLTPPGKHVISVCLGTACYVKGATQILQAIKDELKIDFGQVTPDGLFSLGPARCLGACGLAPVMMIDEEVYGRLNPQKAVAIIREMKREAAGPSGKPS